ncbi:potassium voltage-gated channel protein Shal [Caerostris extrusa]|uniref:Potassium voltage-gated channel protein Shal n=1 Tax=Caerostris extrusa TaxID=172846 RepID=A0AAV4NUG0_CAEEX|nr:potassium voltage-gated channel protein Shal [Caerostris extrusa]
MARIRIAKATTGAAFVSKKKAVEARIAARESGQEVEDFPDDIFRTAASPPAQVPRENHAENIILQSCCGRRCSKKSYQHHRGTTVSDHEEELNDVQVRLQNRTSPDGGHFHRPSLGNATVATTVSSSGTATVVTLPHPDSDRNPATISPPGTTTSTTSGGGTVRISTL